MRMHAFLLHILCQKPEIAVYLLSQLLSLNPDTVHDPIFEKRNISLRVVGKGFFQCIQYILRGEMNL